jgi:hypothetical protein
MFPGKIIFATWILASAATAFLGTVAASKPVSLELVLAIDCSLSVNDLEFDLQIRGIADAFRDEEVIAQIMARPQGIVATVVQWNGTSNNHQEPPWRLLTDRASIFAFADEIDGTKRYQSGYHTAIGRAIDFSSELIVTNAYAGQERKIDISGDGRNNAGPEPSEARLRALANGIVINGLAVLDGDPDLLAYYQTSVAGGPGSFVLAANTYADFAAGMRKKLRRELLLRLTLLDHSE